MGFNYGMTNINASIGLGQLKSLNKIVLKKEKIHKIYSKKTQKMEPKSGSFVFF